MNPIKQVLITISSVTISGILVKIANAQGTTDIPLADLVYRFYNWGIGVGGVTALAIMVFAGVLYTTSAGNSGRQSESKKWIMAALGGLALLFSSFIFLNLINGSITNIAGFSLDTLAGGDANTMTTTFTISPTTPQVPTTGTWCTDPVDGVGYYPYLTNCPVGLQSAQSQCTTGSADIVATCIASYVVGAVCPIGPYVRISQFFGGLNNHPGLDISAIEGTPLYATEGGTVRAIAGNGGAGNSVNITTSAGRVYKYFHMQKFIVRTGQRVVTGQLIGYVDSTGNSTGNHLHYEIRENGVAIDPYPQFTALCT